MSLIPPMTRGLRLANLSDLPRIGIVAAAGFYHSPIFHFERPRHASYLLDTLANYRATYQRAILDPASAVLVVEDDYNAEEVDAVYGALSLVHTKSQDQSLSEKTRRVIVGVASLSLFADARRIGTFLPEGANPPAPPDDPKDLKRDKSPEALKLMDDHLCAPEQKWLSDKLEIATLVVHPAYWRQGHGSTLIRWCMALAEMDGVGIGVSAAPTGRDLYVKCGFGEAEVVKVPGYDDYPAGMELWIGTCKVDEGVAESSV